MAFYWNYACVVVKTSDSYKYEPWSPIHLSRVFQQACNDWGYIKKKLDIYDTFVGFMQSDLVTAVLLYYTCKNSRRCRQWSSLCPHYITVENLQLMQNQTFPYCYCYFIMVWILFTVFPGAWKWQRLQIARCWLEISICTGLVFHVPRSYWVWDPWIFGTTPLQVFLLYCWCWTGSDFSVRSLMITWEFFKSL